MSSSVSVVVPAYNCAAVIPDAIESAWAQTVPPLEVIVVDDGSQDGEQLEAALRPWTEDGRLTFLRCATNRGPAAARNVGVKASSGKIIALLDADDRFEREHLEVALETYRAHPRTAMTCTDAYVEESGRRLPGLKNDRWRPIPPVVTFERLLEANCVHTLTVTFRREVFDEFGPFDEDRRLLGVEDYDMWLRVAARGGTIRYVDRPLCCYSITPGSMSADPWRLFHGVSAVFEKLEREIEDLHERHGSLVKGRRRKMRADLAYNLCTIGEFAAARRAAWAAISANPLTIKPYRLLLKAALGRA